LIVVWSSSTRRESSGATLFGAVVGDAAGGSWADAKAEFSRPNSNADPRANEVRLSGRHDVVKHPDMAVAQFNWK
jgi:hypothetical protein